MAIASGRVTAAALFAPEKLLDPALHPCEKTGSAAIAIRAENKIRNRVFEDFPPENLSPSQTAAARTLPSVMQKINHTIAVDASQFSSGPKSITALLLSP